MSNPDETVKARCLDMSRLIQAYRNGVISFDDVVNGLEQAINGMIGFAEQAWLNDVRSIWGQLEMVYALMLDEGRKEATGEEKKTVNATLEELTAILTPYD